MTDRSFYITDFSDEHIPCEPTLAGWADWLANPTEIDWPMKPPADGATFEATAILWQPDIIATRKDGVWSLSRDPDENAFVAVRFGKGLVWSGDQIVTGNIRWDEAGGMIEQPMADAIRAWLTENDALCDDVEYIATGTHENGWMITYRAGPPPICEAERAN